METGAGSTDVSSSHWTQDISNQCINCNNCFNPLKDLHDVHGAFDYSKGRSNLNNRTKEQSPGLIDGDLESLELISTEGIPDAFEEKQENPRRSFFVSELAVGKNSSMVAISSVLNAVFRLNIEDEDEFSKSLNICIHCAPILAELYDVHQKFNELRSLDSFLSKQLQTLDTVLQQNQPSHPIKCEVSIEVNEDDGDMFLKNDYSQSNEITQPVNYSNNQKQHSFASEENVDNKELVDNAGPWVRLRRMKLSTPVAASKVVEAQSSPHADLTDEDSQQNDYDDGDYCPYDSDPDPPFDPPKKKRKYTKKSLPKEKKEKVGRGRWKRPPKTPDERLMTAAERNRLVKSYRRKKLRHPNPCWYCDETFESPENCAEHTKAQHFKEGNILCDKCSRICKTSSSFSQHQKQCDQFKPGEKLSPHICPQCSKGFAFRSDLVIHQEVHNEEGKFACDKCDFRAKSQLLINNHAQRMHTDKQEIFKCDDEQCTSTFKTKQCMRIHYVNMHTEKGHKRYREQLRRVLDRQKVERRKRLAEKSYVCSECNIDFFSNLRLISHRKSVHSTDTPKNFVCDQCGKDFSRAPALRFHLEHSHSDLRPYICEHCGKGFKSSCNLKDHVNHTHSEEGRREYNQKMRLHNQRRKLVAQALSRKAQVQPGPNSFSEQNPMYMDPIGTSFNFSERQF